MVKLFCIQSVALILFFANIGSANATFTPPPKANFSPIFGTSTSTNFINVTFSMSPNGHPGLVGKTLYVSPVICNVSGFYSFTDCEVDEQAITTVYFANLASTSVSVTFSNLALYYLGSNYVMCYVYDPVTENGDFCGGEFIPDYKSVSYSGSLVPVFRFWSDTKQHHFYTTSHSEKISVENLYADNVWKYERPAFFTSRSEVCDGDPVYRFWSDTKQGHFYTINWDERQHIIANYPSHIWKYEGISFCSYSNEPSLSPVYRFWSDTKQGHFYTISESEKNYIVANYPVNVWKYEGVAFYAYE